MHTTVFDKDPAMLKIYNNRDNDNPFCDNFNFDRKLRQRLNEMYRLALNQNGVSPTCQHR